MRTLACIAALCLVACQTEAQDPLDHDTVWQLVSINGAAVTSNATLTLNGQGRLSGKAPCNTYSGTFSGTRPAFTAGPIRSTKRACPNLALEQSYFAMLDRADQIAVTGDTLTLLYKTTPILYFEATD